MANVLAEGKKDQPGFLFRLDIRVAGDAVTDGFHLGLVLLVHYPRAVQARGKVPQSEAVDPKPLLHETGIQLCYIADCIDTVLRQFLCGRPTNIDHL